MWVQSGWRRQVWLIFFAAGSSLLLQGPGECELRGARAVAGGLGGPKHRVGPDLLRGPQQPNHTVHRPTPLRQPASSPKVSTIVPLSQKNVLVEKIRPHIKESTEFYSVFILSLFCFCSPSPNGSRGGIESQNVR